ncbi:MAG: cyclase family protein [Rhodospirillales bacterium]|nr:cyclase family protein [Rhodospirillales bacterium]
MCLPECHEVLAKRLGRRGFLGGAAAATVGAGFASNALAAPVPEDTSFSRVVDLTHALSPEFPTFGNGVNVEIEAVADYGSAGYNVNRWHLVEHTGTHMDAPLHFIKDGIPVDQIDPANLVVPLAVIDVRAQAARDPDYRLTPDDITVWEAKHGRLPDNCCVALNSGWSDYVAAEKFRNADPEGTMHFPGFHSHTAALLIQERNVAGIAVDTLSLDFGGSKDFATHHAWLLSGRWGLECIANLDQVPARGATLVVGAPKIKGATGGPSRLFALV